MPVPGMGLSLWDSVPQGTLSLLTFSFPKGNFPQQSLTPRGSGTSLSLPVGDVTLPKDPAGSPLTAFYTQSHPSTSGRAVGAAPKKGRDRGWISQADFPPLQDSSERWVQLSPSSTAVPGQEELCAAFSCAQHVLRISLCPGALPRSLSVTEPLQLLSLHSQPKPCFSVPVVLFSPSCASRFLFSPSRRFPFLFPLEFFLISPPVAFWVWRVWWPCRGTGAWHSVPSRPGLAGLGCRENLSRALRSSVKWGWTGWRCRIPCRTWQRQRHPSLKLLRNAPRGRNSHEPEQL